MLRAIQNLPTDLGVEQRGGNDPPEHDLAGTTSAPNRATSAMRRCAGRVHAGGTSPSASSTDEPPRSPPASRPPGCGTATGCSLSCRAAPRPTSCCSVACAGCRVRPLNWRLAVDEMLAVARDAQPSAVVVHSSFADAADQLDEATGGVLRLRIGDAGRRRPRAVGGCAAAGRRRPSAAATWSCRSTRPGQRHPQGVLLTRQPRDQIPRATELGTAPEFREPARDPLFHVGGLAGVCWACARRVAPSSRLTPRRCSSDDAPHGHHTFLVPTLIQRLCRGGATGFPDLEAIVYGAAPISAYTASRARHVRLRPVPRLRPHRDDGAITQVETRALTDDADRHQRFGRCAYLVELTIRDPDSGQSSRRGRSANLDPVRPEHPGYFHDVGGAQDRLLTPDGYCAGRRGLPRR